MNEEFVASFINEARELLFQLESDLLVLEKMPENRQITDNIFRVMHTLKGASRMYGFDDMQHLAHEFEALFDQLREGKIKVSRELIDDTLRGKDLLLAMLDRDETAVSDKELIHHLASRYKQEKKDAGTECAMPEAVTKQRMVHYCIVFTPDAAVFERGLNPQKVIHELNSIGSTHIVLHEGDSTWEEQMMQRICHSTWEIYLAAPDNQALIDEVFLFYDEDEYFVFQLPENEANVDASLEEYLRKQYDPLLSCHEHIQSCLSNLPVADEVSTPSHTADEGESPDDPLAFLPKSIKDTGIKVSSQKLDELLNLVSELVITTATIDAQTASMPDTRLRNAIENLEKLTKKFRSNALDLRLIPVGNLLRKFNRQVRDLSASLNKRVNLILEGQETEIDKTILKSIESPLMHIIRNSIDHGIESPAERIKKGKSAEGRLKIAAFYSGANVVIQVHDDGRGINLDRIRESAIEKGYLTEDQQVTEQELLNLIMEPGFTTSQKVSMVSGRGVGMDVVKKELNAIGGSIEIETEKDLGTSITMKLPTTLSIIDSLLLEVDQSRILIPLLEVEYCYRESRSNIYGKNSNYLPYKDNLVPFISLRRKFKFRDLDTPEEMVIIISKYDKKYAIIVDDIIGEQQAVIKPLGELFINQPYYSGGSIMADGKLALVLDTNYLFNQSILN